MQNLGVHLSWEVVQSLLPDTIWCTVFLQSNVTATTCSSHAMAFDRGLSDNCSFVVNVYRVPDEISLYS